MSVIEDVKQKTDIVAIIGQYTTLKKAGRTYRGLCPFHSEKAPSFFVYPDQQSWHCFGACNTGGDVFAFFMKQQGITFGEALRLLAERVGVTLPLYNERSGAKNEKDRIHEANLAASRFYHELLVNAGSAEKARYYLKERGINLKTLTQFQFGYAPNEWEILYGHLTACGFTAKEVLAAGLAIEMDNKRFHDRFRNKLMIPISDINGHITGFGARVLDNSQPKYINSPQTLVFDKSGMLYGINFASESIRKQDCVIIVEGYMDVVTAHQYGFTNVVAAMGTAITEKQITIIKRLTKNVILALDADSAGEKAMLQGMNYENLLDSEVRVILLPEGKDPDEVIKEDIGKWKGLVNSGIPVMDYAFKTVTAGLNLSSVKDKTIAVDKLLPVVSGIMNDVRRDHYLNRLAEMTGTSYRSMEMALVKLKAAGFKRMIPVGETAVKNSTNFLNNPVEEFLLSLILRYPELRSAAESIPQEYFENSENCELFKAWRVDPDVDRLKQQLDNAIREHLELIMARQMSDTNIEKKYNDCSLRLHEKYLRSMEKKKAQILALEREEKGAEAELAKQAEQGTDISEHLKTVFTERNHYQRR